MIFPSPFDLAALAALTQAVGRVEAATRGLFPALPGATAPQRAAVADRVSRLPTPQTMVLGFGLSAEEQQAWRATHAALRAALSREVVPRPQWMDAVVGYEAGAFGTGPQAVLMYDVFAAAITACWISQHGGSADVFVPVAQFVRAADYALSQERAA